MTLPWFVVDLFANFAVKALSYQRRIDQHISVSVADGHKFSAVKRLSRGLLDRSKNNFQQSPPAFGAHVGGDPIGISSRYLFNKRVCGL